MDVGIAMFMSIATTAIGGSDRAGKDWTVTVPVVVAACGMDVYQEAVFDLWLVSVSVCLLVELAQRHIDLSCISHKRRHRECK